jgi:hypothetical protein
MLHSVHRQILGSAALASQRTALWKSRWHIGCDLRTRFRPPEMLPGTKVRKTPSWPRSWANFNFLSLYPRTNAWANLHRLGQPNTSLAQEIFSIGNLHSA